MHQKQIIYRRNPITDEPTAGYNWGVYFEEGTYEYYDLFRSKAKINTYKSLKWHLLVLWYLNPKMDTDEFIELAEVITNYEYGFITFFVPPILLEKIIRDQKLKSIYGLKIDIEGHEDKALVPFLLNVDKDLLPKRIVIEKKTKNSDYPGCAIAFKKLNYTLVSRSRNNSFYKKL